MSSTALCELRMLESKGPSSSTDRRDVIEAVVLHLHELMLAAGASTEPADGSAVRGAMRTYIDTIVRQLELPNSCIVAMVIYVQRAVDDARFTLTARNWQPCLLAAFVVTAKLSFDEPVWNEDFVKALRISNVQTSQISRWEADFLQLIKFNTNVPWSSTRRSASNCMRVRGQAWQASAVFHLPHAASEGAREGAGLSCRQRRLVWSHVKACLAGEPCV